MSGHYTFPAIVGRQGQKEHYIIECPLQLLGQVFIFDEASVPKEWYQHHPLNSTQINGISKYIVSNKGDYIIAPMVATTDSNVVYEPLDESFPGLGLLKIPLTANLVIQDGQHRLVAVRKILEKTPELGNDTVSVMILIDSDLRQSPLIYNALNHKYVRRNTSRRILHDQTSPLAAEIRKLIEQIPLFQNRIELEKTTISNRSNAIFTLSAIHQATQALVDLGASEEINDAHIELMREFWTALSRIIPEWNLIINGNQLTTAQLRQNFVHTHSVTLLAMGKAGHDLISRFPEDWQSRLEAWGSIDWSRKNQELWEGRAMVQGRMSKAHQNIQLTTNVLKQTLGLQLSDKESEIEAKFVS